MMARRPSGDSPTHLTLYRVAKGRVLDLLFFRSNTVTLFPTGLMTESPSHVKFKFPQR